MEWFKDQFAKSNIISGILAIAIWGVILYLSIVGQPIPDILIAGGASILAFFYDAKKDNQKSLRRAKLDVIDKKGGDKGG